MARFSPSWHKDSIPSLSSFDRQAGILCSVCWSDAWLLRATNFMHHLCSISRRLIRKVSPFYGGIVLISPAHKLLTVVLYGGAKENVLGAWQCVSTCLVTKRSFPFQEVVELRRKCYLCASVLITVCHRVLHHLSFAVSAETKKINGTPSLLLPIVLRRHAFVPLTTSLVEVTEYDGLHPSANDIQFVDIGTKIISPQLGLHVSRSFRPRKFLSRVKICFCCCDPVRNSIFRSHFDINQPRPRK